MAFKISYCWRKYEIIQDGCRGSTHVVIVVVDLFSSYFLPYFIVVVVVVVEWLFNIRVSGSRLLRI